MAPCPPLGAPKTGIKSWEGAMRRDELVGAGQGGGSRVGSTTFGMWSVFGGLGKAEKTSPNIGIPDILTRPGASARLAPLTRKVLRVLTSCSSGRGWGFLGWPQLFFQRRVGKWSGDMVESSVAMPGTGGGWDVGTWQVWDG